MNIAIDIDGVLTNLEKFILNYGIKYCIENKIEYSVKPLGLTLYDEVANVLNISEEYTELFWKQNSKYYFTQMSCREFSKEIIDKLNKDNKIFIITARNDWGLCDELEGKIKEITKDWLSKEDIYYDELIFSEDKLEVCIKNKIDLIIEDSPNNIEKLNENFKIFCFDAVYNRGVSGKNIDRVYSWYDVLNKIENMK